MMNLTPLPQLRDPSTDFMKLETYNHLDGDVLTNSQFYAWQFLSFFLSSSSPQVASLDTSHAQYVISLYVVPDKEVPFGS